MAVVSASVARRTVVKMISCSDRQTLANWSILRYLLVPRMVTDMAAWRLPNKAINEAQSGNVGVAMLQNLFSNQKKTSDYTVLVIEDDYAVREAIMDNLREEGYAVISAINGQDALQLL